MRFRFCGGLEPPDWLQAEIPLLASLAHKLDLTALCDDIADDLTSQRIDRVLEHVPTATDANHAAKYNVSRFEFERELQQFGLDAIAIAPLAHVFSNKRTAMRLQLDRLRFQFPHIESFAYCIRPASDDDVATGTQQLRMIDLTLAINESSALACGDRRRTTLAKPLLLSVDENKFFALYDDLLHAHALVRQYTDEEERMRRTEP